MEQTFNCKEHNCNEIVQYVREVIPGLASESNNKPNTEIKIVYLSCEHGHMRRYEVKVNIE